MAIIHYRANKKSNRLIKNDIFLFDQGQYKFGTTDITRTIGFEKNQIELKIFFECFKGSHYCY